MCICLTALPKALSLIRFFISCTVGAMTTRLGRRKGVPVCPWFHGEFVIGLVAVGVRLVEYYIYRLVNCRNVFQCLLDDFHLFLVVSMRDVHDMNQDVCLPYFIKSALECLDQLCRQFPDKPYCIAQQERYVPDSYFPYSGVQGCKQFIFCEHF